MSSFPNKSERQRCWDARDHLWKCLDGNGDQAEKCQQLRDLYEKACPSQWVKHFDRKRDYLRFKERMVNEGYEPLASEEKQS